MSRRGIKAMFCPDCWGYFVYKVNNKCPKCGKIVKGYNPMLVDHEAINIEEEDHVRGRETQSTHEVD